MSVTSLAVALFILQYVGSVCDYNWLWLLKCMWKIDAVVVPQLGNLTLTLSVNVLLLSAEV